MSFLHTRSMLLLRISLGIAFFWFGVLKLFNVSPFQVIIQKSFPPVLGHSQLFLFVIAIVEIFIGLAFLANRFIKLASIIMIILLIIVSIPVFISEGFDPRFPLLSPVGETVVKNLVLIAAGLMLIAEKNLKPEEEIQKKDKKIL